MQLHSLAIQLLFHYEANVFFGFLFLFLFTLGYRFQSSLLGVRFGKCLNGVEGGPRTSTEHGLERFEQAYLLLLSSFIDSKRGYTVSI